MQASKGSGWDSPLHIANIFPARGRSALPRNFLPRFRKCQADFSQQSERIAGPRSAPDPHRLAAQTAWISAVSPPQAALKILTG